MRDPDNKFEANSTWEALPRRQLLLKFLASLALLGVLFGLMLGQLLQPRHPIVYANTVEQLSIYADGLSLCLRKQVSIQTMHEQGTYQLLLENTRGRSTRGELLLAGSERITWRVEQQGSYLQVAFIGLQPIFGQWHTRVTAEHWCVDMKISTTQQRPHEY